MTTPWRDEPFLTRVIAASVGQPHQPTTVCTLLRTEHVYNRSLEDWDRREKRWRTSVDYAVTKIGSYDSADPDATADSLMGLSGSTALVVDLTRIGVGFAELLRRRDADGQGPSRRYARIVEGRDPQKHGRIFSLPRDDILGRLNMCGARGELTVQAKGAGELEAALANLEDHREDPLVIASALAVWQAQILRTAIVQPKAPVLPIETPRPPTFDEAVAAYDRGRTR